uniref:Uncharacterized protein n=1 Tax=Avena sativa TaxID=4498 RepID=A0ACD5Z754_AVESA
MAWSIVAERDGLAVEKPPENTRCHADLKGWLLDVIGRSSSEQNTWMLMLLYNLWLVRNDAREPGKMEDPRITVRRTAAAIEEWHNLQPLGQAATMPVEHWTVPDTGWCKVNADGAFRKEDFNGGGGVVLRDHHGGFLAGACRFFPYVADLEGAELLACRESLLLARECQVPKIILKTDCQSVRSKLMSAALDRSVHGAIVEEMKELLSSFRESSVSAVRRSANGTAHILAKEGCDNKLI